MPKNKTDSPSGPAQPAGPVLVEVEAVSSVKHGGIYFEPGDALELPLAVAEELLALGAVRVAAPEGPDDDLLAPTLP